VVATVRRVPITSRAVAVAATAAIVLSVAPPAAGAPAPRPGQLLTVAGIAGRTGYSGDGGDARQALLGSEVDVAVAADGTVYIADQHNETVRAVTADGRINPVPMVVDRDEWPSGPVAVDFDGAGALYVATGATVRRRNPDGTFTVIAGGGDKAFGSHGDGDGGDGGPATAAKMLGVEAMAVAPDGTVYLADRSADRIRRVGLDGVITTIVDGEYLDGPIDLAVDGGGNVYFVDYEFHGVRKVAPDGTVSTVLGQNIRKGFAGDGGPAAEAEVGDVGGIDTDADGRLYVVDRMNRNVRVIDGKGVINTIGPSAGAVEDVTTGPDGDLYLTFQGEVKRLVHGTPETSGGRPLAPGRARWTDREPGTVLPIAGTGDAMTIEQRSVGGTGAMAVGPDGTLFTTATHDYRVIAIRPDGKREVYAGSGSVEYSGDGGPAIRAGLGDVDALAVDQAGNLYLAEAYRGRIRKVDAAGTITTIAGTGQDLSTLYEGPIGDGGPATAAVVRPSHLAAAPDGSLYVADELGGGRIRRIDPRGTITTVAGGGEGGPDATSATEASFGYGPLGPLAVDQAGNAYFVVDERVHVVRPDGGLSPVTSDGRGFAGDGGPAGQAQLNRPRGVAVGPDGSLYVADTDNNRVRAVRPDGTITTVAGTGTRTDDDGDGNGNGNGDGDGGPAAEATLVAPTGVATDAAGNVYVATSDATRIRRIDTKGVITTVARFGLVFGGPATEMVVDAPGAVCVDPAGTVYIAGYTPLMAVTTDGHVHQAAGVNSPVPDLLALAAGPDGSVYLTHDERVDRIYPDGTVVTVAGGGVGSFDTGEPLPPANGRRATSSVLDPGDVAIGPSGELYVTSASRVYRLNRDGTLESIANLNTADGFDRAEFDDMAIAVTRDGKLYVAGDDRVFTVSGSGEIRVFAGNGDHYDPDDDGGDATEAALTEPEDLAVAPDGTVYIATMNGIRRVSPDGDIDTVLDGRAGTPGSLALDAHGNLYFTVRSNNQVFVLVRPGELAQPFPWPTVWWATAIVAALAVMVLVVRRRRVSPRPSSPAPECSGDTPERT